MDVIDSGQAKFTIAVKAPRYRRNLAQTKAVNIETHCIKCYILRHNLQPWEVIPRLEADQ